MGLNNFCYMIIFEQISKVDLEFKYRSKPKSVINIYQRFAVKKYKQFSDNKKEGILQCLGLD